MTGTAYLTNSLDHAGDKAKYDTQVKKILSDKYILAWILKYSVKEFRKAEIQQVIACIEGEPDIEAVPVNPGSRKPGAIVGMAIEDAVLHEGKVIYDIRFRVVTPAKIRVKMYMNIEAQKKYHPGYDLVTRAVFYCARMLSSQLDTEFTTDNYDDMKKVYSIWICMDAPKYAQNTITEYSIAQKKVYGEFAGRARYDLLAAVMICIGKSSESKQAAPLHRLLATVLSDTMTVKEKTDILQREYDIPTQEVEEVLDTMCNLSDRIEENGIEKGRLLQLLELVRDGILPEETAASKAGISVEAFKKKMLQM